MLFDNLVRRENGNLAYGLSMATTLGKQIQAMYNVGFVPYHYLEGFPMEINVRSDYASVDMHIDESTTTRVRGFEHRSDGENGSKYGNPAFVSVELSEGEYGKDKQVIKLYLTPQGAEELLTKLTHGICEAYGQPIDE